MSIFSTITPILAWIGYGAFLWWIGHSEQVRPRRGQGARIRPGPLWLRRICSIPSCVDSVHIPMAIFQIGGLITAVAGPALVVTLYPVVDPQTIVLWLTLAVPVAYCVAEVALGIAGRGRDQ